MLARFPWTTHNLESISVWQDIQYINHMANRWFWKHTRQATHALEVLVGVVLVNVHFFFIYSMNFTMTYYNAPFSHLLVNWMLKILGLAQMRRQYFHQWEPRLLPSFFLQWDQSLRNWTRVLIRSPESWAPLENILKSRGKVPASDRAELRGIRAPSCDVTAWSSKMAEVLTSEPHLTKIQPAQPSLGKLEQL